MIVYSILLCNQSPQSKKKKKKQQSKIFHVFVFVIHRPDGCDQALDGVGHSARMAGQNRPGRRVFGVYDQRACGLQQVGGAVEHGASRLKDGLLCCSALNKEEDLNETRR